MVRSHLSSLDGHRWAFLGHSRDGGEGPDEGFGNLDLLSVLFIEP